MIHIDILSLKKDPDFYYLIGLICTDGSVVWKGKTPSATTDRVNISQSTDQISLLYKIHAKFGGFVTSEKKRSSSYWVSTDSKFIKYLRNDVGIGRNKTFNLNIQKWFKKLTKKQKKYFMRGVLDGDGNVFHDIKRDLFHKIMICSASKSFIKTISKYFYNCKIYTRKVTPSQNSKHDLYYINISGPKCIKYFKPIFDTIDKDGIFLEYKYNKFKLLKQRYGTII
jgi:hypothetical protein